MTLTDLDLTNLDMAASLAMVRGERMTIKPELVRQLIEAIHEAEDEADEARDELELADARLVEGLMRDLKRERETSGRMETRLDKCTCGAAEENEGTPP